MDSANIGGGPALNVLVAQKKMGGEWFNPVRVPPCQEDGEFILRWLDHVNTTGLGATYTDFEDRPYTSTCGDDLSQSFRWGEVRSLAGRGCRKALESADLQGVTSSRGTDPY